VSNKDAHNKRTTHLSTLLLRASLSTVLYETL
jgi:hypothetical protein